MVEKLCLFTTETEKEHEKEKKQDDNGIAGGMGKVDHDEDKNGEKAPPEVNAHLPR